MLLYYPRKYKQIEESQDKRLTYALLVFLLLWISFVSCAVLSFGSVLVLALVANDTVAQRQQIESTPLAVVYIAPIETPTVIPTDTALPTATDTIIPTSTPIPTSTNTETPIPTNTAIPIPTDTPIPLPTDTAIVLPTNTLVPTDTSTPLPTDTPRPTSTPLLYVCNRNEYNCSDFPLSDGTTAQTVFEYCRDLNFGDVHDLDRDDDSLACENPP